MYGVSGGRDTGCFIVHVQYFKEMFVGIKYVKIWQLLIPNIVSSYLLSAIVVLFTKYLKCQPMPI